MPISKSLLRRSKSSDHSQTKSIGRINEDESNDVDPDKFTEALADTQKTMTKLAHRRVMSDPLGNGADPKSAMLCESDILPTFPPFVAGSVKAKNCWSQPPLEIFSVRGGNYLQDSKKVGSGPCLLKTRGCDLLLSCHAPSNIGRLV
jgi:poly(3-hydroxybutyrate) depolymerase